MPVTKNFLARPYQYKVLRSKKPIIALVSGVGAGKTTVSSMWALQQCRRSKPGEQGLIAAQTYQVLIDATLTNFYAYCREYGIPIVPKKKPMRAHPVTIQVKLHRSHWTTIYCRSLTNYEALSGTEIAWAVIDEAFMSSMEAFALVQARLRGNDTNQCLISTTPPDPSHWLYDFLVNNFKPELMDYFAARTIENAKNLPKGYIERLKILYDKRLYDRMLNAMWISLNTDRIYHNFDRDVHVTDELLKIDPNCEYVLWAHDFNCAEGKPMSSIVAQLHYKQSPLTGLVRYELHVIDEIIIEKSSTYEAVHEFEARYSDRYKHKVMVYGDPAGKATDTRSKKSDYDIMQAYGYVNQNVAISHPPIRTRHNTVNSLLKNVEGDVRIFISPKCKTLIKGLNTVRNKTGTQIEHETYEQHVTTALGYLCCQEFDIADDMLAHVYDYQEPRYWQSELK